MDELLEEYRVALADQAGANASYAAAQDNLEIILSEILAAADASEWKAKATAKASSSYKGALHDVVETREKMEGAKARVVYLAARFDAWRTKMATHREKMRRGE